MDVIKIMNPDTKDFTILFDGEEYPALTKALADNIEIIPGPVATVVRLDFICHKAVIENTPLGDDF